MRYPVFAGLMAPDTSSGTVPACIRIGQELAQRLQGPLAIAVGAIEIKTPVMFARASVGGLVAAENKRHRDNAKAVCDALKSDASLAAATSTCDVVVGELAQIREGFASRARLHGFVVTDAAEVSDLLQYAVVETLLFDSGRPVLVVPHNDNSALSLETALVAWDGSHTAARAVWNALPLLQASKRIVVACVTGEKDLGTSALGSDIGKTLASAGLNVETVTLAMSEASVTTTLLKHAGQISTDFIVLGAYGHARWREFVFGGVTRDMLRDSGIPMLMSN
jgi:nucleotide-binding universal stress UspA family protein